MQRDFQTQQWLLLHPGPRRIVWLSLVVQFVHRVLWATEHRPRAGQLQQRQTPLRATITQNYVTASTPILQVWQHIIHPLSFRGMPHRIKHTEVLLNWMMVSDYCRLRRIGQMIQYTSATRAVTSSTLEVLSPGWRISLVGFKLTRMMSSLSWSEIKISRTFLNMSHRFKTQALLNTYTLRPRCQWVSMIGLR